MIGTNPARVPVPGYHDDLVLGSLGVLLPCRLIEAVVLQDCRYGHRCNIDCTLCLNGSCIVPEQRPTSGRKSRYQHSDHVLRAGRNLQGSYLCQLEPAEFRGIGAGDRFS